MAQARAIPKHVAITLAPDEAYDLILSLRALVANFYADESMEHLLAVLVEAYDGDIPAAVSDDDSEGVAA